MESESESTPRSVARAGTASRRGRVDRVWPPARFPPGRRSRIRCGSRLEHERHQSAGGRDRRDRVLGANGDRRSTRRADTMNRLAIAMISGSTAIASAIGCSSSVTDHDGETRWLRPCNVDSDCDHGLSCLCNTCTHPCGGTDCGRLGTNAACVTLTPSSLSADCELAPGIALCSEACSKDADCSAAGSGLRCIGGACLAGSSESRGSKPTSTATWLTDLITAICTWAVRCGEFPDGPTCRISVGPAISLDDFNTASAALTAVSDGNAAFDATAATACLEALSNVDCSEKSWTLSGVPASCAAAFSGSVPDGAACIDDVECSPGSMCIIDSTTTCQGTCTPASGGPCRTSADCPSGQACATVPGSGAGPGFWGSGTCFPVKPPGVNSGDPCGAPVECAPGLYCGAAGLCAADVGAGTRCGGFDGPRCASGLACAPSDDGTTNTCMPEAKLGDPCTSLFQCGAQYAVSDLICDVAGTHTCVRRPSTGPCVLVRGIDTCDPATSYCDVPFGSTTSGTGTCKAWVSLGAQCSPPINDGFDPCGPFGTCEGSWPSARCVARGMPACTPK